MYTYILDTLTSAEPQPQGISECGVVRARLEDAVHRRLQAGSLRIGARRDFGIEQVPVPDGLEQM